MAEGRVRLVLEATERGVKSTLSGFSGAVKSASRDAKDAFKRFGESFDGDMRDFRLQLADLEQYAGRALQAFLAYRGVTFLRDAVNESLQARAAVRALAAQARQAGQDVMETYRAVRDLTKDGLVDEASMSRAVANLTKYGFSLEESKDLLIVVKDAAVDNRQAQDSLAEAVLVTTEGIKNENSVLSDAAGLTENIGTMFKKYAKELGKSATNLSDAEKRQAILNGVLSEGEAYMGAAAAATRGLEGALARLNKVNKDAKVSLGNDLAPSITLVADAFTSALNKAREFISGVKTTAADVIYLHDKINLWLKKVFGEISEDEYKRGLGEIKRAHDETVKEIVAAHDSAGLEIKGAAKKAAHAQKEASKEAGDEAKKALDKQKALLERTVMETRRATMNELEFKLWALNEEHRKRLEVAEGNKELEEELAAWYEARQAEILRAEEDWLGERSTSREAFYAEEMERRKRWFDKGREELQREIDDLLQRQKKLDEERLKQHAAFADGVRSGLRKMGEEFLSQFELGETAAARTAQVMEQSFSTFFFDAMRGQLKSLGDYINSFVADVQRVISQLIARQLVFGLAGYIGGMWAGGTASAGAKASGQVSVGLKHEGGPAGESGPRRLVPKGLFSGAPRLHMGLRPDEFPAILQTGERVLSRKETREMSSAPSVQVNVINRTGVPAAAKADMRPRWDGRQWVVNVVMDALHHDYQFREAVRGVR